MTGGGNELTRPLRLDRLGTTAVDLVIEADEAARAALAARFDLPEVKALRAELSVRRRGAGGWIEVSGTLSGEVVQTCVVTTDPVPGTVATDLFELFDDSGEVSDDEIVLDPMADTPEPIDGDVLDLGEIVAQSFGLALEPYPRAPGAEAAVTGAEPDDERSASPFAKLAAIKGRSGGKG